MKSLAIFCLLASTAFADSDYNVTPAVGNTATYSYTRNGKVGTLTHKLTDYKKSSHEYVIKVTWVFDGKTEKSKIRDHRAFFHDNAQIVNIMNNCSHFDGELVDVSVPAGNFRACKSIYNYDDGVVLTVYIAMGVPFGYVRRLSTKGNESIDIQLMNFKF